MRQTTILATLIAALLLPACGTPAFSLGGGGGAGAGTGDTSASTTPIEPMIGINQPGGIDGVDMTRLSYGRAETGSQQAPAWALHLQPGASTGTADYPNLTTINLTWVNMQGNSQRDRTLSPDQIGEVAGVVTEAAKALAAANAGNASAAGAVLPTPE